MKCPQSVEKHSVMLSQETAERSASYSPHLGAQIARAKQPSAKAESSLAILCTKCSENAIIELQHGAVCRNHFISYFEEKVFATIKKYKLIDRNDLIAVACSGGKDSQAALHLIKKYFVQENLPLKNIIALAIDEGIKGYRDKTLADLRKFCKDEKVQLKVVSVKKVLGHTLDAALKKVKRKKLNYKPCHLCGVWRRYLLNKTAREMGTTKVITGHNLDDEAQVILMNWFKANTSLAAHLGPISGTQEHAQFVPRVKPLYFCTEKETKLYSFLKKIPVGFQECPYAEEGYRAHIRDLLNDFEQKYSGTKQGIINSFLDLLPLLKTAASRAPINSCTVCHEPANQKVCNACKILGELNG